MTYISDVDAHDLIMGARTRKLIDEGTFLFLTDYIRQVRELRRELHHQNEAHLNERQLRQDLWRRLNDLQDRYERLEEHCARLERRTSR